MFDSECNKKVFVGDFEIIKKTAASISANRSFLIIIEQYPNFYWECAL